MQPAQYSQTEQHLEHLLSPLLGKIYETCISGNNRCLALQSWRKGGLKLTNGRRPCQLSPVEFNELFLIPNGKKNSFS